MKFMCPQAEGRAEMPWRKETCPADITRCPPADSRGCLRGCASVRVTLTLLRLQSVPRTVTLGDLRGVS